LQQDRNFNICSEHTIYNQNYLTSDRLNGKTSYEG